MVGGKGRIGGELKNALKILDDDVLAFILGLTRDIYVNGKINKREWNRVRRRVLNTRIHTPYNNFDKRFSTVAAKFQKMAFKETSSAMNFNIFFDPALSTGMTRCLTNNPFTPMPLSSNSKSPTCLCISFKTGLTFSK